MKKFSAKAAKSAMQNAIDQAKGKNDLELKSTVLASLDAIGKNDFPQFAGTTAAALMAGVQCVTSGIRELARGCDNPEVVDEAVMAYLRGFASAIEIIGGLDAKDERPSSKVENIKDAKTGNEYVGVAMMFDATGAIIEGEDIQSAIQDAVSAISEASVKIFGNHNITEGSARIVDHLAETLKAVRSSR